MLRLPSRSASIAISIVALTALGGWALLRAGEPSQAPLDLVPPVDLPPEEPLATLRPPGLISLTPEERRYTRNLSDAFFAGVVVLAAYLKARGASVEAEDLLAVFLSESGVNPRARNSIGCVGINQICEPKNFGWSRSREEYQALPAEAQLPYVKRYVDVNVGAFAGGDYSVLSSLGKLYLLNAGPAFIKQPESFVMHRRDPKGPLPSASAATWQAWLLEHSAPPGQDVYGLNRALDFGRKGYIEVADVSRFVQQSVAGRPGQWAELQERLADARAKTVVT